MITTHRLLNAQGAFKTINGSKEFESEEIDEFSSYEDSDFDNNYGRQIERATNNVIF